MTIVSNIDTQRLSKLAHRRAHSGCDLEGGASAVPAGGLANRPRAARVTDRPALRPVSAERGGLRQVERSNAPQSQVSGSAGLGLSRCRMRPARRVPRWSAERRARRSADGRQHSFVWRARAPPGTAKSVRAFRRSAPFILLGRVGRAFLQRGKPRVPRRIARTMACIRPREAGEGDHPEGGGGGFLSQSFVVVSEQWSNPAPRPPHFVRSRRYRGAGKEDPCRKNSRAA